MAHLENLLRDAKKLGAGIVLACSVASQACAVDPVPPPPPPLPGFCESPDVLKARNYVTANANWVKSGGKWTIEVSLFSHGGDMINFEGISKEDIDAEGASLQKIDLFPQQINLVLMPVRGSGHVELDLAIHCDKKQIPYRVRFDVSGQRKKRGYIPTEAIK